MDTISTQKRILEENIEVLRNFIQTATEHTQTSVGLALQELANHTEKEKEKLIEYCNELKDSYEEEFKDNLISDSSSEITPLTLSLDINTDKIRQAVQESFTFNIYSYQNSLKELHRVSMLNSSYTKYNVKTGELFSNNNTPFSGCIAPAVTPLDNGNIFISGGISWQTIQAMSRCIEFDPQHNIAYGRPNLNRPRGYHSAYKFGNKILIFGGSDSDSFSAQAIKEIEEYDMANEEWKIVGELQTARSCQGVAEYKGKVYITGGWSNAKSIEIFNLSDYSITMAEPMLDIPGPSIAVTLSNFILIIHGKHISKYFPDEDKIVFDGSVEFSDLGLFTSSPPVCYQNKLYFTGNWQHEHYNVYDIIGHQLTDLNLF